MEEDSRGDLGQPAPPGARAALGPAVRALWPPRCPQRSLPAALQQAEGAGTQSLGWGPGDGQWVGGGREPASGSPPVLPPVPTRGPTGRADSETRRQDGEPSSPRGLRGPRPGPRLSRRTGRSEGLPTQRRAAGRGSQRGGGPPGTRLYKDGGRTGHSPVSRAKSSPSQHTDEKDAARAGACPEEGGVRGQAAAGGGSRRRALSGQGWSPALLSGRCRSAASVDGAGRREAAWLGWEGISEAAATGLLRGNHGARWPGTESAAWVLLTAAVDSQRGRRKGVPGESLQAWGGRLRKRTQPPPTHTHGPSALGGSHPPSCPLLRLLPSRKTYVSGHRGQVVCEPRSSPRRQARPAKPCLPSLPPASVTHLHGLQCFFELLPLRPVGGMAQKFLERGGEGVTTQGLGPPRRPSTTCKQRQPPVPGQGPRAPFPTLWSDCPAADQWQVHPQETHGSE